MIENEMTVSVPLEVVKASEIEPKEVKWLWYPYIPFGKVTLLFYRGFNITILFCFFAIEIPLNLAFKFGRWCYYYFVWFINESFFSHSHMIPFLLI